MLLRAILILMLGAGAAMAQEAVQEQDIAGLMQTLPEKTLKRLRAAPDAFLVDAAGLIYGFGAKGGIDAAGIKAFVAVERAQVRGAEMKRYLAADLDNDGDVVRDEVAVLANASAADKRGALLFGFDLADANKDTVLSLTELRSHAQGVAMKKISDADEQVLLGFLVFDLDSNGTVAMEEAAAGVNALIAAD